jgi:hypothetical protein
MPRQLRVPRRLLTPWWRIDAWCNDEISLPQKEMSHGTLRWIGCGLEETIICVIDREGKVVRETMVSTEPAAIRCALEGYADRLQRVGVEASSLAWISQRCSAFELGKALGLC